MQTTFHIFKYKPNIKIFKKEYIQQTLKQETM